MKTDGMGSRVKGTPRAELLDLLKERLPLRWHMFGILFLTSLAIFLVNEILFAMGVLGMPERFFLDACLGYFAFFPIVKFWYAVLPAIRRVMSRILGELWDNPMDTLDLTNAFLENLPGFLESSHKACRVAEALPQSAELAQAAVQVSDAAASGSGAGDAVAAVGCIDGDTIVLLILGLFASIIFGVGIFMIYNAPEILSESLVQMMVSAGQTAGMADWEECHWAIKLLEQTIAGFFLALMSATLLGAFAASACPKAVQLWPVIQACLK